jgi:hypothetical protein
VFNVVPCRASNFVCERYNPDACPSAALALTGNGRPLYPLTISMTNPPRDFSIFELILAR